MLKKTMQARLTIEELHQLKWIIGSLLTLFSLWALSGLEWIGRNFIQLSGIATSIVLIKPKWVHSIPTIIWSRFVAPFILVVAFIDFGFGFTNFFPPLMHLIVLLLVYRALAPRTQREDLQMLLLCLLGIVISGTLTLSLAFALQILLFTPFAMAFLLIICLLDRGPGIAKHSPNWQKFNWVQLISRVWNVIDFRVCVFGTLLFAFVVVLSTVFFTLIPRFDLGQAVSLLKLETKSVSGFSETVRLDSVSEIIEDHSIVLRIDVPNIEAIHSTPYWRVLVLDQYSNGVFRLSNKASQLRKHEQLRELSGWGTDIAPLKLRKGNRWTLYFEGGISQYLPLPSMFYLMRFTKPQDLELLPDLHVVGLDAVQQNTFSYQIEDLFWNVRTPASNLENETLHGYSINRKFEHEAAHYPLTTLELALKPEERARLTKLNRKLKGRSSHFSAAEYSRNITAYLRDNFRYSLNPNGTSGEGDPIVNWIEKGNSGHCELFSGAFILLAREAGYAARMAVGFVGGSWNSVEDFFVVRNSNAHAWAEIYDAETKEWLRVDPTPGESSADPEIVLPASFELETGMNAWVDSLRMQWYRRIVNFDYDDQTEIVTSVMNLGDLLVKKISSWIQRANTLLLEWMSHPFSRQRITGGVITFVLCLGILYLWQTRLNWLHFFHRLAKKSQTINPIRRQSSKYLRKLSIQISEPGIEESHLKTLQLIRAELEVLRFGPDISVQLANPVLKRAQRILLNKNNIKF